MTSEPGNVEPGKPLPLWPTGSAEIDGIDPADVPRLTPYLCGAEKPTGAVVVCPGGGYFLRAEHEGEPVARRLNEFGIHAFVLDYRVAPHRHPAPQHDAQRAIRLVRRHAAAWHVRPDRIAILGFSAGGHLAATAGTQFDHGDVAAPDPIERQSARPDALILCYPVISFDAVSHPGSADNLLGPDSSDDLRRLLSAELHVTADTPPAFLWHTGDDAGVPNEHSLLFAAALRRNGVPFALHIFPHGEHGLGLAPEHPQVSAWAALCGQWLADLDFGPGATTA